MLTDSCKEENGLKNLKDMEDFRYCKNPKCNLVYFSGTLTFSQKDLTVDVGLKENSKESTVCYCFDWNEEKIKKEILNTGKTTALEDIKEKMDTIGCTCEIKNPSGKCCLVDVAKVIEKLSK
jgi:hypothetical protein